MAQHKRLKKITSRANAFIRTSLKIPFRLHVRYKHIASPSAKTYVMIHGLADTGELWRLVVDILPKDANHVVIDLLGHGKSRHSKSKVYSADYQARNVITTCLSLGLVGKYIFIGHSFGSIVAVECAKRYPRTKSLILCALPLYNEPKGSRPNPKEPESILFEIYKQSLRRPKFVVLAYNLIGRLGLGGPSRTALSRETFSAFEQTVRYGIMNQQTRDHLRSLKIPITIIYGKLDPFIISKNITEAAMDRQNIKVKVVMSDHALRKPMLQAIKATIKDIK